MALICRNELQGTVADLVAKLGAPDDARRVPYWEIRLCKVGCSSVTTLRISRSAGGQAVVGVSSCPGK
jgi:hypothetical protein